MTRPPKFLSCILLSKSSALGIFSEAAAAASEATGIASAEEEADERASGMTLQVLFPVASAIILPPFLNPSMLSIRSGTVMKAKDPARATIRGKAIMRSLDNGPGRVVLFEAVVMMRWRNRVDPLPGLQTELRNDAE